MQSVWPAASWYRPPPQPMHMAAALFGSAAVGSPRYFPVPHVMHVLSLEADVASEYLPAAQSAQSASLSAPSPADHVPAGHAVQSVALELGETVEYLPGPHLMQSSSPLFPVDVTSVYLPARQLSQSSTWSAAPAASSSVCDEYVPAGQAMQLSAMLPSAGKYLPATHAVQAVVPVIR